MEKEKATVWVTKYAFTKGIFEKSGEILSDEGFLYEGYRYLHKNEWHHTKKEAIKHAEKMRKKGIASLKKQLEKLEKMRFE